MLKEHQKATIKAYDNSAKKFNNTIAQYDNYDETYDYLVDHLNSGDSVLDLACGPGNISGYLAERRDLNVTGYDLSQKMLELARERIPHGMFKEQSIIDFTVEDPVDLVINGFGFPYLHDQQIDLSLASSYRALKSPGLLYISFMDGDKEGFETTSFHTADEFYLLHHDKQHIRSKLESIGFTLKREWTLGYEEADGSITDDIIIIAEK